MVIDDGPTQGPWMSSRSTYVSLLARTPKELQWINYCPLGFIMWVGAKNNFAMPNFITQSTLNSASIHFEVIDQFPVTSFNDS